MITVIRRFVVEARKWRCFFIGSGQTMDAEILPTRVTQSLNSRIVFFSSDMRARMAGLETDAIKTLLPLIRRAGPGVMVFDCARFDKSVIGAIPSISTEDMLTFLGVASNHTYEIPTMPLITRDTGPLHTTPMKNAFRPGCTGDDVQNYERAVLQSEPQKRAVFEGDESPHYERNNETTAASQDDVKASGLPVNLPAGWDQDKLHMLPGFYRGFENLDKALTALQVSTSKANRDFAREELRKQRLWKESK
jgi:hypothetical protein